VSHNRRHPGLTALVATTIALLLVAVSLIVGRVTAPVDAAPGTRSAEAGFARDMQMHHDQAVEMSMIVRDRTDDEEIRLLAYDIATAQARQSGQMFGWLAVWGLSQASPEPPMTWMHRPAAAQANGHEHGSGESAAAPTEIPSTMPGMATREQLDELRSASGVEAERRFLELMIAHHAGGVDMAEAVLDRSATRSVDDLARSVITSQESEIRLMERLLSERRGTASEGRTDP
jgi:uncharacterized protein (DUF305 family)